MRYFKRTILIIVSFFFLFTACSSERNNETDDLEEELDVENVQIAGTEVSSTYAADEYFSLNYDSTTTLHPFELSSDWNEMISMLIYEPMVCLDENFDVTPNAIIAWSTDDGITWSFTVDTSRYFHSGGKVTPSDCVATLDRAVTSGRYVERFDNVSEYYVENNNTFVVKLYTADYRFYTMLDIPLLEEGTTYQDIPSGIGPYMLSGDILLLDENYPYANSMPILRIYLKEFTTSDTILQAFEDSRLDMVVNSPTALSNLGYAKTNITKYVDTTSMHYIGFNAYNSIFGNYEFRKAINYAVNRSEIVSSSMQGAAVEAVFPIHPYSSYYPQELESKYAYSAEKLRSALENCGLRDGDGDGFLDIYSGVTANHLEINFICCNESAAKVSAARNIAQVMENAGLIVNLRELSYSDYIDALESGDFDMYYAEVILWPNWNITEIISSGGDMNYGSVGNTQVDSALYDFMASDEDHVAQAAEAYCQQLAENASIITICFERKEILYHRGVLTEVEPMQDNYFNNMKNWTVNLVSSEKKEEE